jgi:hypothetical protein
MKTPFRIFGPFKVDKQKAAHKEYQKIFWNEHDKEFPKLSEATGL